MHVQSRHPSQAQPSSAGFTLIEMMVTIAVVAILASMALPSFQTMIERNRVTGLINQFSGAFMHARNEAVTRNKRVVVCRSANPQAAEPTCETSGSDWRSGWIVFVDEDGNSARNTDAAANETLLRV